MDEVLDDSLEELHCLWHTKDIECSDTLASELLPLLLVACGRDENKLDDLRSRVMASDTVKNILASFANLLYRDGWNKHEEWDCPKCKRGFGKNLNGDKPYALARKHSQECC